MKIMLLGLLACAVLVSCAPPPPDVAEVRKTIEAMMDKAEKDMMAGVVDTTMSDYTDDAVSMPNNAPMSKGKAAIRQQYMEMEMGIKFSKVDFTTLDVNVSGNHAYEIGTYSMTMEMMGMPPFTDKGKYLSVYELGTNGKWRLNVETGNTDTPPPMPEPPNEMKPKK